MRNLKWIAIWLFFAGCIEKFEFDVSGESQGIVVEGFISDVSFNDMLAYPQDPRYFELEIKYASTVKNVRDQKVIGANIELSDNSGEVWDYAEIGEGRYGLFYNDFKAELGREYKLTVRLQDGTIIESDMEHLPQQNEIGDISIHEKTKKVYENNTGDTGILEIKGIDVRVETKPNPSGSAAYLKWDFLTTWIYDATRAEIGNPNKYCWNTTEYYFQEFVLLEDRIGNRSVDLFFLKTLNAALNDGFSVLLRQSSLSRGHFIFWQDIQNQEKQSDLFAPPPYNTNSNLSTDGTLKVHGYFGVVSESFSRWYYDESQLTFDPGRVEVCAPTPGVPAIFPPSCFDCLQNTYDGPAVNQRPWWWK